MVHHLRYNSHHKSEPPLRTPLQTTPLPTSDSRASRDNSTEVHSGEVSLPIHTTLGQSFHLGHLSCKAISLLRRGGVLAPISPSRPRFSLSPRPRLPWPFPPQHFNELPTCVPDHTSEPTPHNLHTCIALLSLTNLCTGLPFALNRFAPRSSSGSKNKAHGDPQPEAALERTTPFTSNAQAMPAP